MIEDDFKNDVAVQEEIVLQHTNNNKTEFITSSQLLEVRAMLCMLGKGGIILLFGAWLDGVTLV